VICPNCGRDYGSSLLRFEWCPGDRAYFCSACTREKEGCPACKSKPSGVHLGVAGLALFILLVVSASAVLPQHISRSMDIGTDPVNFENATAGRDVKLQAALKSPEKVAFHLILRDGRWQLLMKANASVVDAKGKAIRLDLAACHDFYPLFHNKSNTTKCEYQNGDKVTVFGRVRDDGAGNRTLDVRRLYPGEKDPYLTTPGWYQSLYLIPIISLILFLQVLVFYLQHRHQHSKYIAGHPVADKELLEPGISQNDIRWRESPVPERSRGRARRLTLVAVLLFAGIVASSALAPWVWDEYPPAMVTAVLVFLLCVVSAYYLRESAHISPAQVGFSGKGLHLRYVPAGSPVQIVTLKWPDIRRATKASEFWTARIKLFTDKRIEETVVPRDIWREIESEHARQVYPGQ
jgi:hypothetical protein